MWCNYLWEDCAGRKSVRSIEGVGRFVAVEVKESNSGYTLFERQINRISWLIECGV